MIVDGKFDLQWYIRKVLVYIHESQHDLRRLAMYNLQLKRLKQWEEKMRGRHGKGVQRSLANKFKRDILPAEFTVRLKDKLDELEENRMIANDPDCVQS